MKEHLYDSLQQMLSVPEKKSSNVNYILGNTERSLCDSSAAWHT